MDLPFDLECLTVGMFAVNSYLITCRATGRTAIVDTGDVGTPIVQAVKKRGLTIERLLITHGHIDHVGGLPELKAAFDVPIHFPALDAPLLAAVPMQARMFGLPQPGPMPALDEDLSHGQQVRVGEVAFEVIHVPGHSPGHIALVHGTVALVGDVLFAGSIGRTDLPGGDYDTLIRSIRERLFPLGDEVVCYPGHGPETTIGEERAHNPFCSDEAVR